MLFKESKQAKSMAAKGGRFIKYFSKIIQRSIRQDNQNQIKLLKNLLSELQKKIRRKPNAIRKNKSEIFKGQFNFTGSIFRLHF